MVDADIELARQEATLVEAGHRSPMRLVPASDTIAMEHNSRIFVAGHRGLAGSAIARRLRAEGFSNLLLRTHAELDLTSQARTEQFFGVEKPEYVFLAAALVGGILANNTRRAEFIRKTC